MTYRYPFLSKADRPSSSRPEKPLIGLVAPVAFLSLTALVAVPTAASAQLFFWEQNVHVDSDDAPLPAPPRPHRPAYPKIKKAQTVLPDAPKPQGPVVIAVSISRQHLKIYDANGVFAETPISTGMRGHSTPMGVFSILEKEKYHRSNIYSGAPMPYMQRITWSGVAMHAGVLPGYPASHGCIRMPMNFAIRMYGWTRTGARVVIAPDDLSPLDITHPLLPAHKPEPQQTTATPAPADAQIRSAHAPDAPLVRTADASGGVPPVPATADDGQKKQDRMATGDIVSATDAKPSAARSVDTPAPDKAAADAPKPAAKPEPKRTGHIAIFISRKEGKVFVRQNFAPLFDAPVTIADGGPLGTHVFTMRADKDDSKTYRWSVVSLPQRSRADMTPSRKTKQTASAAVSEMPATPSASGALDRITIPDDAMQRIAETISPGDSIVVSDLGLGEETGLGTDFIVPLR